MLDVVVAVDGRLWTSVVDQCASDRNTAQSILVQGKVETLCFNFLGAAKNLPYNINEFVMAVSRRKKMYL